MYVMPEKNLILHYTDPQKDEIIYMNAYIVYSIHLKVIMYVCESKPKQPTIDN